MTASAKNCAGGGAAAPVPVTAVPPVAREIPLADPPKAPSPPPKAPPVPPKGGNTNMGAVKPALADKPMWPAPEEPSGRTWLATMVCLALLGLYAWMLSYFYAGAHGGVDQAAYLMTARLIAGEKNPGGYDAPAVPAPPEKAAKKNISENALWPGGAGGYTEDDVHPAPAAIQLAPRWDWLRNRLSFVPESPFQFASRMCVMTEPFGPASPDLPATPAVAASGARPGTPVRPASPAPQPEYRVFAKYPFGFPLLAAIGWWIGSWWHRAIDGMYLVNPVCTVLACYFAYFMFRQVVSAFTALIGVMWLACNPLVLVYAIDANSHATTLFCVCLGYWGLLSWLRTGGLWRGLIGGLALGYACTIRYSEFLHVLPVTFAALVYGRLQWRRALASAAVVAAWALPVAVLAGVCWVCFGSPTRTGYSYCNEDVGFGWTNLAEDGNWETLIQQLNITGLFILWPLALAGLFGLLGTAWRLGGVLLLWVLPPSILYMLYYWAPDANNTGYLRFYISVMPGLILTGLWMVERALTSVKGEKWAGLVLGTLVGLFVLAVVAIVADGGPIATEGGLGRTIGDFARQTPEAIWDLLSGSWRGALLTLAILGLIGGMWLFDRHIIAARMGLALGVGAITALGCAVNVIRTVPQMDTTYIRWTTLRTTLDNVRQVLPRGSVLISDDGLLHEFDSVGGWRLYSQNTFSTVTYAQSRQQYLLRATRDPELDPNPLQPERLRFYMELLAQPSAVAANISLGPRSQGDLWGLERAVIDKQMAAGRRVAFLTLSDPGDMGGGAGPGPGGRISLPPAEALPTGTHLKVLWKWTVPPPPSEQVTLGGGALGTLGGPGGGRGGRGGRAGRGGPGGPGGPPGGGPAGRGARGGGFAGGGGLLPAPLFVPPNAPAPQGATYVLYEVVRQPPTTTPATTGAALQKQP